MESTQVTHDIRFWRKESEDIPGDLFCGTHEEVLLKLQSIMIGKEAPEIKQVVDSGKYYLEYYVEKAKPSSFRALLKMRMHLKSRLAKINSLMENLG